jgi:hypothetical protein
MSYVPCTPPTKKSRQPRNDPYRIDIHSLRGWDSGQAGHAHHIAGYGYQEAGTGGYLYFPDG